MGALLLVCLMLPTPSNIPSRCTASNWILKTLPMSWLTEGKQQYVVETLNIIDVGTSVLLVSYVCPDFAAETALQAVAHTFQVYRLPPLGRRLKAVTAQQLCCASAFSLPLTRPFLADMPVATPEALVLQFNQRVDGSGLK